MFPPPHDIFKIKPTFYGVTQNDRLYVGKEGGPLIKMFLTERKLSLLVTQ